MGFEYLENVPQVLQQGLKMNNKTEADQREDIGIIKEWIKLQPHLPEVPSDNIIMNFLMMNKFSIENAKQKLDMYYSMRSIYPDFFINKHPMSAHMRELTEKMYFIPLPKTTEEGYRVLLFQLPKDDAEFFDIINFFAHNFNVADVRVQEDCLIGDVLIYDFKNVRMGHLAHVTPTLLKKVATIFQKVFNSNVKEIHILNYPSFAETVITLAKQMVKPKIAKRFNFHKETQTISKFIPLGILPKDYGGKELSMKELNEKWMNKFAEHKSRFDELEKLRVKEELRPTPLINDEVLGFHGNFKKLNVD